MVRPGIDVEGVDLKTADAAVEMFNVLIGASNAL